MTGLEKWAIFSAIVLACIVFGAIVGVLLERWNDEKRDYDAEIDGYNARLEADAAARAELASHPYPLPPAFAAEMPAAPLIELSGTWGPPGRHARALPWTDAASIAPVFMPPPPRIGTFILQAGSQASRWPAEDTGQLARLTDTGEMRVADYAAELRAENDAWLDRMAGSDVPLEAGTAP